MKKILIAGGAGFVGSHLCDRLLAEQNNVTCIDNLHTGNLRNIEKHLSNTNFSFIKHNVREKHIGQYDEIYNLACPASPSHYQAAPVETIMTSVSGTYNLLELARETGAKLLQASTSEVYGDPDIHPQKESYWGNVNPNGLRSCYDEGKRCSESLCANYAREYNSEIKIIRIFNTYGPRMDNNDGRVVSNMIIQALKGTPLTIYGNGLQTRSFQYIDDLIEGMTRMMNTKKDITGPINIGNPSEYSILQLAKIVIELTESKSCIVFKNLPNDDPKRRCPDINLAYNTLNGWKPNIGVVEGLKKTIDFFQSQLAIKAIHSI